jgi:hypothetical protein
MWVTRRNEVTAPLVNQPQKRSLLVVNEHLIRFAHPSGAALKRAQRCAFVRLFQRRSLAQQFFNSLLTGKQR